MVPPVPAPATKAPMRPSHCRQISGPVVSSCALGLAGLRNWSVRKCPARSAAMRLATTWKFRGSPGGAFSVITTSAPSARSDARFSSDIFSGITHSSR